MSSEAGGLIRSQCGIPGVNSAKKTLMIAELIGTLKLGRIGDKHNVLLFFKSLYRRIFSWKSPLSRPHTQMVPVILLTVWSRWPLTAGTDVYSLPDGFNRTREVHSYGTVHTRSLIGGNIFKCLFFRKCRKFYMQFTSVYFFVPRWRQNRRSAQSYNYDDFSLNKYRRQLQVSWWYSPLLLDGKNPIILCLIS